MGCGGSKAKEAKKVIEKPYANHESHKMEDITKWRHETLYPWFDQQRKLKDEVKPGKRVIINQI